MAANPARIFGIGHLKGDLRPGLDGDLVLVDSEVQGAQFSEEVLFTQANLKGTDLTGATGLTLGQIESATIDKTTKLPDYLDEEMEDGFLLQM